MAGQTDGQTVREAKPKNNNTTEWAKKRGTLCLSKSSPIINQFSQFFHWHTLQKICNNVTITYPTTSQTHLYTTL